MSGVDWTLEDGVYELRLAHGPCNEIGTEVLAALERFVDDVDAQQAHAVIIHSALGPGFCAGADLRELYQGIEGREPGSYRDELRAFIDRVHRVMDRLDMLPLTTVGALHGVCFGGGFELALTCDILVADRTTRFCFPELRLGIIPGFGGIPRLNRDLSNGVVRDLILTGRSINAKRAQGVGLVSQLVGEGEALAVAREVAKQAGQFDRRASATAKSFMKPLPVAALEQEKAHFVQLFDNPGVVEALGAFVRRQDVMPYLTEARD